MEKIIYFIDEHDDGGMLIFCNCRQQALTGYLFIFLLLILFPKKIKKIVFNKILLLFIYNDNTMRL